jgi:hypothetical protein
MAAFATRTFHLYVPYMSPMCSYTFPVCSLYIPYDLRTGRKVQLQLHKDNRDGSLCNPCGRSTMKQ